MKSLTNRRGRPSGASAESRDIEGDRVSLSGQGGKRHQAAPSFEQQIAAARTLVGQDPKRAAQVVKDWVSADGCKPTNLAGTQRAAILLMSLGEQDAANVLKQLDAREVQKFGIAMAELKEVSREQMTSVLGQVHRRGRRQGEHRQRIAGLSCGEC